MLFCFALTLMTQTSQMHTLSYVTTAQPLTKAPYVVLFDLKPLNEDGNWQVCVHACSKRSLRTHFRACKISKFPGGMPPVPPHTIYTMGLLFVFALGPHNPLGGPAGSLRSRDTYLH